MGSRSSQARCYTALTSASLMLQSGYAYVPYSALESMVELSKAAYYLARRQMQGSIRTDSPNWQPRLTFFLRALAAGASGR